jgi:hypothetical protein
VVVEADLSCDPFEIGPLVRKLVDVQRSSRLQDALYLLQAGVGILHMLQHAAAEHSGEYSVRVWELHWIGRDVRGQVRKMRQLRQRVRRLTTAVIERIDVEPGPGEKVSYLSVSATPVEDTGVPVGRDSSSDRSVLAPLRFGNKRGFV